LLFIDLGNYSNIPMRSFTTKMVW